MPSTARPKMVTRTPEIRLINVAPSALDTEFVKGRGRDFTDRTIAATPLGRLATPREVANAILVAARVQFEADANAG